MKIALAACVAIAAFVTAGQASGVAAGQSEGPAFTAPPIWASLAPGKFAVGFERNPAGAQFSAWYPATDGGEAMTLRAYFADRGAGYTRDLTAAGIPATAVSAVLDAAMAAHAGAPHAAGSFPVVLIAHGNAQDAPDQAVLAEYLASYGYIVVTTPSPMVAAQMTSEDQVGAFAQRQAAAMSDALKVVAKWKTASVVKVGVAGHSFGTRAALLLAMRDPRVRAIVSLDGGIGTATGVESFRKAEWFNPIKATAPIVHYYEGLDSFMTPDFTLLKSLPARLTLHDVTGMHHIHFTTLGFLAALVPDIARLTDTLPHTTSDVVRVARGTLAFLQRNLK